MCVDFSIVKRLIPPEIISIFHLIQLLASVNCSNQKIYTKAAYGTAKRAVNFIKEFLKQKDNRPDFHLHFSNVAARINDHNGNRC